MAYSSLDPSTGAPVFLDSDAPDPAVNPSQVAAFAAEVGTRLIGTTAERTAYAYAREGLRWFDTTTDKEYLYNGSGWVVAWAPETSPGSVVPSAGAGFTLSANGLYTRDGWLLGSIDWAKTSGTLSHADVVMTLPVGARPTNEYVVGGRMGPAPSQIGHLVVSSAGVVSALVPDSGRTSGTVEFVMPIPH